MDFLVKYLVFLLRYMKYLYPYECDKRCLSNPNELQAAIDSNRREGRRQSFGSSLFTYSPNGTPTMLSSPKLPSSSVGLTVGTNGASLTPIQKIKKGEVWGFFRSYQPGAMWWNITLIINASLPKCFFFCHLPFWCFFPPFLNLLFLFLVFLVLFFLGWNLTNKVLFSVDCFHMNMLFSPLWPCHYKSLFCMADRMKYSPTPFFLGLFFQPLSFEHWIYMF